MKDATSFISGSSRLLTWRWVWRPRIPWAQAWGNKNVTQELYKINSGRSSSAFLIARVGLNKPKKMKKEIKENKSNKSPLDYWRPLSSRFFEDERNELHMQRTVKHIQCCEVSFPYLRWGFFDGQWSKPWWSKCQMFPRPCRFSARRTNIRTKSCNSVQFMSLPHIEQCERGRNIVKPLWDYSFHMAPFFFHYILMNSLLSYIFEVIGLLTLISSLFPPRRIFLLILKKIGTERLPFSYYDVPGKFLTKW